MKEGRITRIVKDRKFFFVDDDYWCHFNNYDREPEETHIVEYEPEEKSDGKKNAKNIKFLRKEKSNFEKYLDEVDYGYFDETGNLDEVFIIDYPKFLAKFFKKQDNNKINQVRKFFDAVRIIETKLKLKNDFNSIKPELNKLVPLAENAKRKKNISEEFRLFIEHNINQAVKSNKNFKDGFIEHFQSLIGYYN